MASPEPISPLHPGENDVCKVSPGGLDGDLSLTEYIQASNLTKVPWAEPGNELGKGLLPDTDRVKSEGVGQRHFAVAGKITDLNLLSSLHFTYRIFYEKI